MKFKQFVWILILVVLLLSIPFWASLIGDTVNWSWFDYTVMGVLLLLVGITAMFLYNNIKNKNKRWLYFMLLALVLFIIWAELAVGVFNTFIAGD